MFVAKKGLKDEEKTESQKLYPEINNGIFIPCGKNKKTLLYIKFTYQGIE